MKPNGISAKQMVQIIKNQNNPKFQSSLSYFDLFKRTSACFAIGMTVHSLANEIVSDLIVKGKDWCPEFPKAVYSYARNTCLARESLPGLTDTFSGLTFKCPIFEELIFRVLLQEIVLKKAPKAFLYRFAPSYVGIVDTKVAKFARITLAAIAFSLVHANPPEHGWPNCSMIKLINTFVTGLLMGGIQEVTESPLMAMFFHSGLNIQSAYALQEMGMKLQCP